MSRGLLQRAAIARALHHRPRVLLLDEPFTSLDPAAADRLRTLLREQRTEGLGLVVVMHDLAEVWDLATHVAVMVAVRWVAEACHRVDAHLVHVSTDYVFDGALDRPVRRVGRHRTRSRSTARSKLIGEHEALSLGPSADVVRTSWVCGEHGGNMVKTIMRLAGERAGAVVRRRPARPPDVHRRPRPAPAPPRRSTGAAGIIHATNQGPTTWFGFAQAVVAAMGKDPAMVSPIATADLHPPRPAPRPANSVLDNAVLRAAGVPLLARLARAVGELVAARRVLTRPSTSDCPAPPDRASYRRRHATGELRRTGAIVRRRAGRRRGAGERRGSRQRSDAAVATSATTVRCRDLAAAASAGRLARARRGRLGPPVPRPARDSASR